MAAFTSVPSAAAEASWIRGEGGVGLRLYRMHGGDRQGPPILVGHCNGFSAGCYAPLLQALAALGDVFAFDHRGHGGSQAATGSETGYGADQLAGDVAAAIEAVSALRPDARLHYVGHSLSAAALLQLGLHQPLRFADLALAQAVLIEPPIFPDPGHSLFDECTRRTIELVARTRRRRRHWPSHAAFADALRGRGPFAAFAPGMLERIAEATLRPVGVGFELACAPETEATIFTTWGRPILFPALRQFPQCHAVTLVGGDPDSGPGRDWVTAMMPSVARRMPQARFFTMVDHGHLWPFEAPDDAVSFLQQRVASNLPN